MTGPATSLQPGEVVLGYRIERMVGQGGFGLVYVGHNDGLDDRAAIKEFFPQAMATRRGSTVILTDEARRPQFERVLQRFEETTRVLHKLDHPHIVRVKGFERRHGTAYIAMEFVEGVTLAEWIASLGRAPTLAEVRAVFEPVANALAYMHGKGLLHRDVSPLNIMLRPSRGPILIDFGTLKQLAAEPGPKAQSELVANLAYAPLEQIARLRGLEHGPWTDLYAFAASLTEMLTGAPPPSSSDRRDAALAGAPDPLRPIAETSRITLPSPLAAAIDAALELDPGERPPTVEAFLERAGWTQAGRPRPSDRTGAAPQPSRAAERATVAVTTALADAAPRREPPPRRRRGPALAMLSLIAAAALGAALLRSPGSDRPALAPAVTAPPATAPVEAPRAPDPDPPRPAPTAPEPSAPREPRADASPPPDSTTRPAPDRPVAPEPPASPRPALAFCEDERNAAAAIDGGPLLAAEYLARCPNSPFRARVQAAAPNGKPPDPARRSSARSSP